MMRFEAAGHLWHTDCNHSSEANQPRVGVTSKRGMTIMRTDLMKKVIAGLVFAVTLAFSGGATLSTMAQAQDRDHRYWQPGSDHRNDRDRDWNRDRRDRDRDWDRDRRRSVVVVPRYRVYTPPRVYTYPRNYPSYGGGYGGSYGGYRGGSSYDEQRGYRDGLDRGQEDARDRRSPNPNNSSHYRDGNSAYRDGFRRGYAVGYRQYGGYGRW